MILTIQDVWEIIGKLKQEGLSILLVEQNVALVLKLVDYVHVISKVRVVYASAPQELWDNEEIKSRYLAVVLDYYSGYREQFIGVIIWGRRNLSMK